MIPSRPFSLQPDLTSYELPLNERTRNFLRLEHFFSQIQNNIDEKSCDSSRMALIQMIEACDFIQRVDIKKDLIHELEIIISSFKKLSGNPNVDSKSLTTLLSEMNEGLNFLRIRDYQPGNLLQKDELATQVRKRLGISGGACHFDIPRLYYWINKGEVERASQLNEWMEDLRPILWASKLILGVIRESGHVSNANATNGFYQETLDTNAKHSLLRIHLPKEASIFPEISGGKHRFTIRFYVHTSTRTKPKKTTENIEFFVEHCGIAS
jgi:cell division protein ZapD